MFKKLGILLLLLTVVSCNKMYESAMRSSDKDYILEAANEFYDQGKWVYAVDLYKKISASFAGTPEAADIAFKQADANFKGGNNRLAAHQFKSFYITNPADPRAEEAAFQSAYAYYVDSPEYNRDQKSTVNAIDEMQAFINRFPDSPRAADANGYIDEMREKLEKKYFEIAKLYHRTLSYKAASIAFDNWLDEYPDSKLREEAMIYALRSKYELGVNFSRTDKKELRLQNALTQYRLFTKAFPNSEYRNEADKLYQKIEADLQKHREQLAKAEQEREKIKELTELN